MTDSHLVVDGSNIATEGRTVPSLAQLDEAVTAFTSEYDFDNVIVVVDATFAHRIDPSERAQYEEAVLAGELLTPPAGAIGRGDAFVLEIADRSGGAILSNDSFQEFHADHEWLFEEGRLWGGKPVPGVGWVFVTRLPVRGPASFRSRTSAAKKRKSSPGDGEADKTRSKKSKQSSDRSANSKTPSKKDSSETPSGKSTRGRSPKGSGAGIDDAPAPGRGKVATPQSPTPADEPSQTRSASRPKKGDVINSPSAFLGFVTNHQPGSIVSGEVVEFSSHGAYVLADGARCYIPLKSMGDPPPRSPRELLTQGEVRSFVVQGFDTPRRGVDLALAGSDAVVAQPAGEASPASHSVDAEEAEQAIDQPFLTQEPAEEATLVAAKKTTAKKASPTKKAATATKAPAKTAAKKTTASKSAASKSAASKTAASKTTAAKATAAKKSTATKAPAAKKSTTTKAPAKKAATAKKSTAKSTATKTPAKKTTATTAKKATTTKATAAKKSTTTKAPAKKAPTAKKSTAKSTATKTPAKKTTATTAKKAPAAKSAAKTVAKKTTVKKTTAKKS